MDERWISLSCWSLLVAGFAMLSASISVKFGTDGLRNNAQVLCSSMGDTFISMDGSTLAPLSLFIDVIFGKGM